MTTIPAPSKWIRVNKRMPCPICAKPDWCLLAADGTVVICARIESDKPAGNKGAGWLHRLKDKPQPSSSDHPKIMHDHVDESPRATIDRRDLIYNLLLSELELADNHWENLRQRGLTDDLIQDLRYTTLPSNGDGRTTAIRKLVNAGLDMSGVPGFYVEYGDIKLWGASGILIPVRDLDARIQALQVRIDNPNEGGKYRWISSSGKHLGCGSGSPIHVSHPEYYENELWITEGALKSDIAAIRMHKCILAVAGVGNWAGIIPIVVKLNPQKVIISYDMDKEDNAAVRLHLDALKNSLLHKGFRTFEADWSRDYKGIDDLVMKGDA